MNPLKQQERLLIEIRGEFLREEERLASELQGVRCGLEDTDAELREVRLRLADRGETAATSTPPRVVVIPDDGNLAREAERV